MVPPSLMLSFLAMEWLILAVVAHEEKVPVWTQLVEPTNGTPAETTTYPSSRAKSAVWMDNGKEAMWMFGGVASKTGSIGCPVQENCADEIVLDELWQYNISVDQWRLIQFGNSSDFPKARHSAVACGKSGTSFFLFGGYGSENEALSDTWIFDVKNENWDLKRYSGHGECGRQPEGRAAMLYWCTSDSLWILGGVGSQGNILNDMWRFTFSNGCWTSQLAATDSLGKHGSNFTAPAGTRPDSPTWLLGDKELFFLSNTTSGSTGKTKSNQSCELWTMSTDNFQWKPYQLTSETLKTSVSHKNTYVKFKGESPPCRTSAASWVDENDNLWLFGGHRHIPRFINRSSVFVCDIWVLETSNNTWVQWFQKKYSKMEKYLFRTVPSHLNVPTPRAHAMSWFHNGTLYLFGGESITDDGNVKYLNDFWSWHMGHPSEPSHELLLPPTGVFFVTLGALCFIAICVFGTIFVAKASSPQAPRLKPPSHNGKIKYSPVSTTEDVMFE